VHEYDNRKRRAEEMKVRGNRERARGEGDPNKKKQLSYSCLSATIR
jgi:hypothetical protein